MKILKFGGSSVATAARILSVIDIIKAEHQRGTPLAVVVSALGGVTDALIALGQKAAAGDSQYEPELMQLQQRHFSAMQELIPSAANSHIQQQLQEYFGQLSNVLYGLSLIRELSKRSLDLIMSFGERLSAFLISEALKLAIPTAIFLDARQLVRTDSYFGAARVNFKETNLNIQQYFTGAEGVAVITGFIGATDNGETTTLGRGGSDYSAAIFGAALFAQEIEIWTDVDGVMTADPRKVPQAFPIAQMTYKEALELSHFGAKVIHPPTIAPALQKNIPLRIKNTFRPQSQGTFISHQPPQQQALICGISSIDQISLLRLEGSGMVGVCGVAMRLFEALAKKEINVILISQGSSEHSICIAVIPQHAKHAKEAIEEAFSLELLAHQVEPVAVEENLAVIAVVGENMRHTPGIAGKLFGALGRNGINVVAMVQGSSEYNISIVIKKSNEGKALNVIHEEFFLSPMTTVNAFIVGGTGLVGHTLIAQIHKQRAILQKEHAIDLRIIAVANREKMYFDANGIETNSAKALLEHATEQMDIATFIHKAKALNLLNSVFVDCTSSTAIAQSYPAILEANISIVTPNKKANSGPYTDYLALKAVTKRKGVHFLYETNVGAGLPIISTLSDLRRSGDKILHIEAILSGTLSYLFNEFSAEKSFSCLLRQAQAKGFTEPDPREDLNGQDVLRKLLILARECGYPLEMEDIYIEPLLPKSCFEAGSVEEFYSQLERYDEVLEQKRRTAELSGAHLRYIASWSPTTAQITLQAVPPHHPFFHLSGSDNIIALRTERYNQTPLVIKGQGAGAEVTAGEVFADIIRVGRYS